MEKLKLAFPVDGTYAADALREGTDGMLLLDYFAAKAMQAPANAKRPVGMFRTDWVPESFKISSKPNKATAI